MDETWGDESKDETEGETGRGTEEEIGFVLYGYGFGEIWGGGVI